MEKFNESKVLIDIKFKITKITNVIPLYSKKIFILCFNNSELLNVLNKKEKVLALKSALSTKMSEDNIIFIDTLQIDSHKTKNLNNKLAKFNYKSALFVYSDDAVNDNFKKASSNLPRISVLNQKGINVKDLISYEKIFIEEKSIKKISDRLL